MLRELPETELSDNSDYERWYFEEQRSAWEAEVREAHKVRAGGELNEHSPAQRGMKRETMRSSSTYNVDVPVPLERNFHAREGAE
jgi:hypothetical protein